MALKVGEKVASHLTPLHAPAIYLPIYLSILITLYQSKYLFNYLSANLHISIYRSIYLNFFPFLTLVLSISILKINEVSLIFADVRDDEDYLWFYFMESITHYYNLKKEEKRCLCERYRSTYCRKNI